MVLKLVLCSYVDEDQFFFARHICGNVGRNLMYLSDVQGSLVDLSLEEFTRAHNKIF